ncbi:hypothetical protein AB1L30_00925, partial [Bremerella sp. JC817]
DEDKYGIRVTIEDAGVDNIADISDGLPHELSTEDGWIAKYSRYPEIRWNQPDFCWLTLVGFWASR